MQIVDLQQLCSQDNCWIVFIVYWSFVKFFFWKHALFKNFAIYAIEFFNTAYVKCNPWTRPNWLKSIKISKMSSFTYLVDEKLSSVQKCSFSLNIYLLTIFQLNSIIYGNETYLCDRGESTLLAFSSWSYSNISHDFIVNNLSWLEIAQSWMKPLSCSCSRCCSPTTMSCSYWDVFIISQGNGMHCDDMISYNSKKHKNILAQGILKKTHKKEKNKNDQDS